MCCALGDWNKQTCDVGRWVLLLQVRVAAMSALQMLASRRDRRVAIACRARIKDGDFNVRAAAEAMIRLFE